VTEPAGGIRPAHEHLKAAMAALGVEPVTQDQADADKAAALKVHNARPGIPANVALAVIKVLRAMDWKP
jgi:hypothetical protein